MKIGLRIHNDIAGQPPIVCTIVAPDDAKPETVMHEWADKARQRGYITVPFETDDGVALDSAGMFIAIRCIDVVQWSVVKEGTSQ